MSTPATLSVVIPVLNEAQTLPENLAALGADRYVTEIVVVDGGSTDGTVELVKRTPGVTLLHSAAGRGRQMNVGARHSSGDWLLFHHADSKLAPTAGRDICFIDSPRVSWGGFRHCFKPSNWKLRLISALHNYRWRKTGVVYGDQSMFVRREFFHAVGGFVEHGLEDLNFSDRALQHAPSILLQQAVQTDARKFLQIGEFRALWHVLSIIRRYEKKRQLGNELFFQPFR